MALRQKLELKLTNTDEFTFTAPLRGYILKLAEDNYVVGNDDLALKASGKTPNEAAQNLKEQFIDLANDIIAKSKYAALTERDRKKLSIIRSICSLGSF